MFSYARSGVGGKPDLGRWCPFVLWILRLAGEPWLWSIRPDEFEAFLNRAGWTHESLLTNARQKRGVEYFDVATR